MLRLIKSISRREWRFCLYILVALVILTSLTRIYAFTKTPAGYTWTGSLSFCWMDWHVYGTYVEQARAGKFLFADLYTSPAESRPMFNIVWLSIGLFARLTGLSSQAALEITRLLAIPGLLFFLYLLIAHLITDIKQRKIAFVLAVFAGGWGVYLLPAITSFLSSAGTAGYFLPIDFYVPEAFVFLSVFYSVHFIISLTGFIVLLLLALLASQEKKLLYAWPAGLVGSVLANFHPHIFVLAVSIIMIYWLYLFFKKRIEFVYLVKFGSIVFLLSLPSLVYQYKMLSTPWGQTQAWQSNTGIYNYSYVLAGFGMILVLALGSIILSARRKIEIKHYDFLIVWLGVQTILTLIPTSLQRRFLEGLSIGLCILASYSLTRVLSKRWLVIDIAIFRRLFYIAIFTVVFGFSFIFFMYFDFMNINYGSYMMYARTDALRAIEILPQYVEADGLILADEVNSVLIPHYSLRPVFAAHPNETIDFRYKKELITLLAASPSPVQREMIFRDNGIKYFFYDKNASWQFDPDREPYLEKLMGQGNYRLYRVEENG